MNIDRSCIDFRHEHGKDVLTLDMKMANVFKFRLEHGRLGGSYSAHFPVGYTFYVNMADLFCLYKRTWRTCSNYIHEHDGLV